MLKNLAHTRELGFVFTIMLTFFAGGLAAKAGHTGKEISNDNNVPTVTKLKAQEEKKEKSNKKYKISKKAEELHQAGEGAHTKGYYHTAYDNFEKAAKKGHIVSLYNLAGMCKEGKGCEKDPKKALKYFKNVEKNKDPAMKAISIAAQFNIGCMYYRGEGVAQSNEEALKWLKKAHNSGYPEAQSMIELINQKKVKN